MHLFINALAANSGSGPTYVRNVVPHLAADKSLKATFLLRPDLRRQLGDYDNVSFIEREASTSTAVRFLYEQRALPALIRSCKAEVLISAGNFALRSCPVPQILLSGNSLYLSAEFFADLRARRDYSLWLDTHIKANFARRSLSWADITVAPTAAFANQLRAWAGGTVTSIHHGFDPNTFLGSGAELAPDIEGKLKASDGDLRLLFVSHYNYYRNFETLFRALALLKPRLQSCKVKVVLTCKLRSEDNPGSFDASAASTLVKELGVEADIVELGKVPYNQLHHVYSRCDIYVTAAYAESFAHPLVEAMASGCPVIASDLAVHQEVCGLAARYFPAFSPEQLAARIVEIVENQSLRDQMVATGSRRALDYSWAAHVRSLLDLSNSML